MPRLDDDDGAAATPARALASTTVNPLNNRAFSQRYRTLLKQRQCLPVFQSKERIQKLVRRYQVLLLVGETGSGKTTQVPQYLLEMNPTGGIACTQPRRVAAMSVSERVAEELDVTLGEEVGYTIRFDDMTSDRTKLRYMTDGMLLREAMSDPLLSRYSVIILDEAHERTVATDVLIGFIKGIVAKRPELRVVVMSATLEERKFQKYFVDAPLIHIPGRMYGVEVYFSKGPEANYVEGAIRVATQVHLYEGPGDILIFLCGEDEIETAVERLRLSIPLAEHSAANCHKGPVVVLPLYSALPPSEQRRIFKPVPDGTRKIIVATNIAETSLTIDGVVFVIDCGFSKQKVFNPKLRLESLLVTPISRAAANQRCGRAGRTKPGKCFRLYTAKAFDTLLPAQTHPEILRTDLGATVLHMKKIGIDDLVHFDFIDPPAPETLMRALETLNFLGALDDDGNLTAKGERMSMFPVDPEMAAMIERSPEFGCAAEICKIAAMMSVQSPFIYNPSDRASVRAKEQWYHPTGDHISLLRTFEAFEASGMAKDWCRESFLNERNMRQAANICKQLVGILQRLNPQAGNFMQAAASTRRRTAAAATGEEEEVDGDQYCNHIRRAILAGYFSRVALALPSKNLYITLKDNVKALLFPGTCLNRRPGFVVYNELVLTSNHYLRTVTAVSGDWLIEACPRYFEDQDEFEEGLVRNSIVALKKAYDATLSKKSVTRRRAASTSSSFDEEAAAVAVRGRVSLSGQKRPRPASSDTSEDE